jgi:hypothetical protein
MRNMMIALAACLALALASCDGDGNGNGGVDPTTGVWLYSPGSVFDDTCEYPDPPTDPTGEFTLTNNGDGTFTVDDGDNVFDCTLSGSNFNCPERRTEEHDASPLDAVATVHVSIEGSFSSDTDMTGHQTANATCVGADCADAAAAVGMAGFPCSLSQNFTASYQHP